jgi:hypothetical protein
VYLGIAIERRIQIAATTDEKAVQSREDVFQILGIGRENDWNSASGPNRIDVCARQGISIEATVAHFIFSWGGSNTDKWFHCQTSWTWVLEIEPVPRSIWRFGEHGNECRRIQMTIG